MNYVLFKGVMITVMFAPALFEEKNNETLFSSSDPPSPKSS